MFSACCSVYRPRLNLLHIYKSDSEDRISNFLLGVSVVLILPQMAQTLCPSSPQHYSLLKEWNHTKITEGKPIQIHGNRGKKKNKTPIFDVLFVPKVVINELQDSLLVSFFFLMFVV